MIHPINPSFTQLQTTAILHGLTDLKNLFVDEGLSKLISPLTILPLSKSKWHISACNPTRIRHLTSDYGKKQTDELLQLAKVFDPALYKDVNPLPALSTGGSCFGATQTLFAHFFSLPENERTPNKFEKIFSPFSKGPTVEAFAVQQVFEALIQHNSGQICASGKPVAFDEANEEIIRRIFKTLCNALDIKDENVPCKKTLAVKNLETSSHASMFFHSLIARFFLEELERTPDFKTDISIPVIRRLLVEEEFATYAVIEKNKDEIIDELDYYESPLLEVFYEGKNSINGGGVNVLTNTPHSLFKSMYEAFNSLKDDLESEELETTLRSIELLQLIVFHVLGLPIPAFANKKTTNCLALFVLVLNRYLLMQNSYHARGLQFSLLCNFPNPALIDNNTSFFNKFSSVDPGSYAIFFEVENGCHIIAYQKYPDGTGHLGDVNFGLMRLPLSPNGHVKELSDLIKEYPPANRQAPSPNHRISIFQVSRLFEE